MTSRPNEQQEPSMEEILSSIRRIIADEASEDEGEAGAQAGASESEADLSAFDVASKDAAADNDGDGDDEDVLELTEVVRDDDAVVDLDATLAGAEVARPDFAGTHWSRRQRDAESDRVDGDDEPASGSHQAAATDQDAADEIDHAGDDRADDQAAQSATDIGDDAMEPQQTTPQKKNGIEALVSDQAAGAATGAFAKLSQAIQRTPPEVAIADEGGRSVEQFIEDMMRPMLREWLDQHLPALVERIVEKQIQKIVRRAEDE